MSQGALYSLADSSPSPPPPTQPSTENLRGQIRVRIREPSKTASRYEDVRDRDLREPSSENRMFRLRSPPPKRRSYTGKSGIKMPSFGKNLDRDLRGSSSDARRPRLQSPPPKRRSHIGKSGIKMASSVTNLGPMTPSPNHCGEDGSHSRARQAPRDSIHESFHNRIPVHITGSGSAEGLQRRRRVRESSSSNSLGNVAQPSDVSLGQVSPSDSTFFGLKTALLVGTRAARFLGGFTSHHFLGSLGYV